MNKNTSDVNLMCFFDSVNQHLTNKETRRIIVRAKGVPDQEYIES